MNYLANIEFPPIEPNVNPRVKYLGGLRSHDPAFHVLSFRVDGAACTVTVPTEWAEGTRITVPDDVIPKLVVTPCCHTEHSHRYPNGCGCHKRVQEAQATIRKAEMQGLCVGAQHWGEAHEKDASTKAWREVLACLGFFNCRQKDHQLPITKMIARGDLTESYQDYLKFTGQSSE